MNRLNVRSVPLSVILAGGSFRSRTRNPMDLPSGQVNKILTQALRPAATQAEIHHAMKLFSKQAFYRNPPAMGIEAVPALRSLISTHPQWINQTTMRSLRHGLRQPKSELAGAAYFLARVIANRRPDLIDRAIVAQLLAGLERAGDIPLAASLALRYVVQNRSDLVDGTVYHVLCERGVRHEDDDVKQISLISLQLIAEQQTELLDRTVVTAVVSVGKVRQTFAVLEAAVDLFKTLLLKRPQWIGPLDRKVFADYL